MRTERLETARLVLRRPVAADVQSIFERYASDDEVTRFMSWPTHRTLGDTRAFLAFSDAEWERSPAGPFLIHSREDGRLLGSTGYSFESADVAITGYILARDSWGRGYATEALQAMVEHAPSIGIRRLTAKCHAEHLASAHVLEKCGFTFEGILRADGEFPNLAPGVKLDVRSYALEFS